MKKTIIIHLTIFVIILVCGVFLIVKTFTSFFGVPLHKKDIINTFNNNENLFNKSILEFKYFNKEYVYVYIENEEISISIYEYKGENIDIKKLSESEFYKFSKTIELMKKANITRVAKETETINFSFSAYGQYITQTDNKEGFIIKYDAEEIVRIKDQWYFVKMDI